MRIDKTRTYRDKLRPSCWRPLAYEYHDECNGEHRMIHCYNCGRTRCFYFARESGAEVLWWALLELCVCVSVCLSARISPEPHTRSLPVFLCKLPLAVGWSFSGRLRLMKSQGEGTVLWVSFPTDSIVFGTHTKTAEPIEMPRFGWWLG